jgi:hypothetical protein
LPRTLVGLVLIASNLLAACSSTTGATPTVASPTQVAPSVAPTSDALATPVLTVAPTQAPTYTPTPVICAQSPCSVVMHDTRPYGYLEVKVGTEVIWTSECFGLCSVTFRSGEIDSGPMNKGDTFKHTFSVPGSYPYYCQFDPPEMIGTIIVTP